MKYIAEVDVIYDRFVSLFSVKDDDMFHQVTTDDGEYYQGTINWEYIYTELKDTSRDVGLSNSFVDIHESCIFDSFDEAVSFLVDQMEKKLSKSEFYFVIKDLFN